MRSSLLVIALLAAPVLYGDRGNAGRRAGNPAENDRVHAASSLVSFRLDTPDTFGREGTQPWAINNSGVVVGSFLENGRRRAFIRSAAGLTTFFDIPGSESTEARGINNLGDIVGYYNDRFGFLRKADGTISSIDYPGVYATMPYAINDAGVIVGTYRSTSTAANLGFRRDANGIFSSWGEPAPAVIDIHTPVPSTEMLSVTLSGAMLGRTLITQRLGPGLYDFYQRHFLVEPGGATTYFAEAADTPTRSAPTLTAMNAHRQATGYLTGPGVMLAGTIPGNFAEFLVPDTFLNQGAGINDLGQITGTYEVNDANNNRIRYGFVLNPCTAPVSPVMREHGSGNEFGQVSVMGEAGCLWFASSNSDWITLTPSSSAGAGAGAITYELQPNPGPPRTGTLTVAGQTVTITQAGVECSYALSQGVQYVGSAGGQVDFTIFTASSCPWTAVSFSPLTGIAPEAGRGPGVVQTLIPVNAQTTSRQWNFRIAGRGAVVNQSAAPCTYGFSQASAVVPASGGSGEIAVTAPENCAWTAAISAPWLSITSGEAGAGNGTIRWSAPLNVEFTSRSATISIPGQVFTVNQLAQPACVYALSVQSLFAAPAAGSGHVTVQTASTCGWSAASQAGWVHITSASQNFGPGTVGFTYDANTGAARSGVLQIAGQTVTVGQQSQSSAGGLRFVPVAPCRLADTRPEGGLNGAFGPPKIAWRATRTIPIPESACNVPQTAVAYSLNVTAVPDDYLGYLSALPQGYAGEPVSTLNSWSGRVVANAAIVPAGIDNGIQIYASNATHVIVDINGYFLPATLPAQSLAFFPRTPCRISDSRTGRPAPFGMPALGLRETRTFPITASACPVPQEAEAYSLNATVVPPDYLGFLTLWPSGIPRPNVSTLNSWTGAVVANAAIVPAGSDRGVNAYASNATDLILDINGWFGPPPGGLNYYPVVPCRALDTRTGAQAGTLEGARTFALSGACGVPATAQAVALNATVVPQGGLAFLTLWPSGQSQPEVSTLNSNDGEVVANMAIVPLGANGGVSAYAQGRTDLIFDVLGYFAP